MEHGALGRGLRDQFMTDDEETRKPGTKKLGLGTRVVAQSQPQLLEVFVQCVPPPGLARASAEGNCSAISMEMIKGGYTVGHPPRFARWWTFMCVATSRSRSRLAAKNRPSSRPPLSFSSRTCQRSASSLAAGGFPSTRLRSWLCRRGRGGRCSRPRADCYPDRILRAFLHVTNRRCVDLRSGRGRWILPGQRMHLIQSQCLALPASRRSFGLIR